MQPRLSFEAVTHTTPHPRRGLSHASKAATISAILVDVDAPILILASAAPRAHALCILDEARVFEPPRVRRREYELLRERIN